MAGTMNEYTEHIIYIPLVECQHSIYSINNDGEIDACIETSIYIIGIRVSVTAKINQYQ